MNTTERKLFSYDREEDADIHEFINQLPKRQHSKYIRMALRLLKEQLETGNVTTSREVSLSTNQKNSINSKPKENDDFEDLSEDILNMGK